MKVAYVRRANQHAVTFQIKPIGDEPLPPGLDSFGQRASDALAEGIQVVEVRGGVDAVKVACDWLQDNGWEIWPTLPFDLAQVGYITRGRLKERGWTPRVVDDYLGAPDREIPNEHHRTGPPVGLFALARVELWEKKYLPDGVREAVAKKAKQAPAGG